jgi:hypothetical protein
MKKHKKTMKMRPRHERKELEVEAFGHITPGAAEGDLDTVEQDLAMREQGGPAK